MGGKKKPEKKSKPLEKMTAKELREMAKEIPDITGAHGMNKEELIAAIKKAKGIKDDKPRKASAVSVRVLKAKIKELKKKREEYLAENNRRMADICRRRISRLKKKTRRAAA